MLFKKALRRDLANLAGVVFATLFTIMVTTTLIRLLGSAAAGGVDTASVLPLIAFSAINILPVLLGKKSQRPVREATILHSGRTNFAIRQGDWVLIDAPSGDGNITRQHAGEPEWFKQERGYAENKFPGELYDLRDDLPERRNLYGEKPKVVGRLKGLLDKYKTQGRSTPGPPITGPESE